MTDVEMSSSHTKKRPRSSSPSTADLTLFCCLVGSGTVFSVHISSSDTVDDLKKAIKEEISDDYELSARKLALFKVSLPEEDDLAQKVEDAVKASKPLGSTKKLSKLFSDEPPEETVHIAVKLPDDAQLGKSKHSSFEDASRLIERWRSKRLQSELPTIAELASFVDRPLSEEEKIPISAARMQELVTNIGEDLCTSDDVKLLFRLSDSETPLDKIFVTVAESPPTQGTENAFISFWDKNVREILELLLPDGRSNRNSSQHTATRSLRPDYAFLLRRLCPFRGEEKGPDNIEDPRSELSDKLAWAYSPAPYVLGYYATGPDFALAAISAPQQDGRPVVHDIAYSNLRLRKDRIKNICRLINLAGLIRALADLVRPSGTEFEILQRENSTVEIAGHLVIKCYTGSDKEDRVSHLRHIYALLREMRVPHVDSLVLWYETTLHLSPRGVPDKPKTERELLEALICVLEALEVLHHAEHPVFHRDIRWPNVVRYLDNPKKWFMIDWEDAATAPTKAQSHFDSSTHSPRIFVDGHGAEVDIWGVGELILQCGALDMTSELRDLGKWMQDLTAPSAREALRKIKDYQLSRR